ncbi:3-keto-5-aminohexanoate cleavage protein [Thalassotalea psychrophila]|uniref:3-keto-5-aminohexanoate cleavage protein n=1 Tax=Thalassotalea psychrophila TaxID=3065647 RepID=A0ABY9TQF5_9GAMM|nr:3-keto-5-aminohexanoate cleavage protein [Colwelliaceae bacterium SQ149]
MLATNAELVDRARTILNLMGTSLQTPAEARETLQLKNQR